MTAQAIRELLGRHMPAVTILTSLGALLDARASGQPLDPALERATRELLDAFGAGEVLDGVSPAEAAHFIAELRYQLRLDEHLLYADRRTTAWSYNDPQLLQAVGDFSRNFARAFSANMVPALDGLAARFAADDAAFLDIGTGVGGVAIELATIWPRLRITGIDVWQPSLALARDNVAAAGLASRIELREQAAEALTDERAYDAVWFPIPFMPERVVPAALERSLHALRPGGWVLLGFGDVGSADPRERALWRLRTTVFGGPLWTIPEVQAQLAEHGFTDLRRFPTPPGAPVMIVARRPTA